MCALVCLLGTIFGLLYRRLAHPPVPVYVALSASATDPVLRHFFDFDGLYRRAPHMGDAKSQQLLGESIL